MASYSPAQVAEWARTLADRPAEAVLDWALSTFHPRLALAWSGAEDVALVDLLLARQPATRIFLLDTGRLDGETYDAIERVRFRYGCTVEVLFPDHHAVEAMVREKGVNLFYDSVDNRRQCCQVRKVEPLRRILATVDAWITGMRRDQGVTRTAVAKVELDEANGQVVKVNPLADWSHDQVWRYLKEHAVPYNALHDRGYTSIGCAPCTRAVAPGEDLRAGRWWWENPEAKECGLHLKARP